MGNNLKEKVCLQSREDGEQTRGPDRDKEMLGEQLPRSAERQKSCQQPSSCQPSPSWGSEGAETVSQQRLRTIAHRSAAQSQAKHGTGHKLGPAR